MDEKIERSTVARHTQPEIEDVELHDAGFEEYCRLHAKRDYPALVNLCAAMVEEDPDDLAAVARLGDAYVLNGEYQRAIDFAAPHLERHPYHGDLQYVILDALFALGKTEDDFPWDEKPKVLHLTADVLDSCYDYLRPKRKPRTVNQLHNRLFIKGYLTFSRQELHDALRGDSRFVVTDGGCAFSAEVVVARKSRRSHGKTRPEGQGGHGHGKR